MVDYIIPEGAPMPRAMLGWDGADYYVLRTDAAGNVQMDALGNANLDQALQSIAADRLQVRGEDQLFSFKGVLVETRTAVVSGASGYIESIVVPAGEVWVVTTLVAHDSTSPLTSIYFQARHDGVNVEVYSEWGAFVAYQSAVWSGHTYLDPGDTIRAGFAGSLVGDSCILDITGYRMTLEV